MSPQEVIGERGVDERAGSYPTDEVTLVEQLLVGGEYREPRHAQVGGHPAGRWYPYARAEPSVQDGLADPVVDLPVERMPRMSVQGQMESGHPYNLQIGHGLSTG